MYWVGNDRRIGIVEDPPRRGHREWTHAMGRGVIPSSRPRGEVICRDFYLFFFLFFFFSLLVSLRGKHRAPPALQPDGFTAQVAFGNVHREGSNSTRMGTRTQQGHGKQGDKAAPRLGDSLLPCAGQGANSTEHPPEPSPALHSTAGSRAAMHSIALHAGHSKRSHLHVFKRSFFSPAGR